MSDMTCKTNGGLVEKKGVPVNTVRPPTFTPRVDILETPREMWLHIDMPGVKAEDVELNFERGELIVHGKAQPRPQQGKLLMQESEPGDFYRAFLISQDIAADKIEAELKHGVLTVRLPRADSAQPRRIAVKAV